MKDQLVKALVLNEHVRLYIVRSTDMVQEAMDRFDLHPCACAALGRTLSIASMMGAMLKSEEEMLTVTINGHGPIGSIVVDAYADGNVRGFVSNPHVEDVHIREGKLNVGAVVGTDGTLTVTKDLSMQDNFSGTVNLVSGEIGEDFAYYFTLSEQTPTAVSCGVLIGTDGKVSSAGALILQMLPDANETDISICEHVLSGLKPMSELILEYDDASLEDLVNDMFEDAHILSTQPVAYHCPCDKKRMARALATIKKSDVMDMAQKEHGCQITCNFCNERYSFTEEELLAIASKMHD